MPAYSSLKLRSISLPFSIYNLGTRLLLTHMEIGEAPPVADEASLFRGRLPISGYAGSADWFEPTVHSLLGYLRAKSRICGGELTCLQQPQAPLDLLAVFHI